MTFTITEPQDQEEELPQQRQPVTQEFTITPPGQEQEEGSFLRGAGAMGREAIMGFLDTAMTAFGGGPSSMMAQDQQTRLNQKQAEYDEKLQELQNQGLQEEDIQSQIGKRPDALTIGEAIDIATGGAFIPQTPGEKRAGAVGKGAGEFAAITALMPGATSLLKIGKETVPGGLFGLGSELSEEAGGGPKTNTATGFLFSLIPTILSAGKRGFQATINAGKRLLDAKKIPTGTPKFFEEVGKIPEADLQLSSRDLTGRVAKTSEESISKFEKMADKVSEQAIKPGEQFRAADIEKQIIEANQKAILNRISPATETQKKSWEGIQKYVEGNFEAAKASYTKLYDMVEGGMRGIRVIPQRTHKAATSIMRDLEESLIKAPEEGGVRSALSNLVNTLKPMSEEAFVEIPAKTLMATKRSINRLLEKSDIIPGAVDLLKPVSRAIKEDLLNALEGRPGLRGAFEAADKQFAKTQKVFNNPDLVKMRKSANPEDLTSMFTKPSSLQRLNEAIGDNKNVKNFLDKMVVENISKKNKVLAQEMANETRQYLSSKGKKGLDRILEMGDTLTTPGAQAVSKGTILQDLQQSVSSGVRPTTTLNMMKSPVGYNLVKDTLNRSPKGRRMFKSLQKMTVDDLMSSTIGKNKQIDFDKAKDLFSNPHMKTVIKEALGKEGLEFFQKLETYGENMAKNIQNLAAKDLPFFQRMVNKFFSKEARYVLYALAPFTMGKSLAILFGGEVAKTAYRAKLFKILKDPQARSTIREMARKGLSPKSMENLMRRFAQIVSRSKREDKEPE